MMIYSVSYSLVGFTEKVFQMFIDRIPKYVEDGRKNKASQLSLPWHLERREVSYLVMGPSIATSSTVWIFGRSSLCHCPCSIFINRKKSLDKLPSPSLIAVSTSMNNSVQ
jgi:hypothetical protein